MSEPKPPSRREWLLCKQGYSLVFLLAFISSDDTPTTLQALRWRMFASLPRRFPTRASSAFHAPVVRQLGTGRQPLTADRSYHFEHLVRFKTGQLQGDIYERVTAAIASQRRVLPSPPDSLRRCRPGGRSQPSVSGLSSPRADLTRRSDRRLVHSKGFYAPLSRIATLKRILIL